jgi:homoserine O-acetyltransferase
MPLKRLINTFTLNQVQLYTSGQPFPLECGLSLPKLELAYKTLGKLSPNHDNVVWVCHALTANAEPDDWWSGLIGEGKFLDPANYFIVCVNVVGSCYGSTNALSVNPITGQPYYHSFPLISIRDMVRGLELVRKHLDIDQIYLALGGSLGAMQVLEWCIMSPGLIQHATIIASNARHSAWGIAFNEAQRMAIEADASWKEEQPEAGKIGMKAARAMALLSYRNYSSYELTQTDTDLERLDNFRASSYERYQGEKLYKRFHAFSYWTLSKAMDSHNVGRGRGGMESALAGIHSRLMAIGISSDLLFPPAEQQFIARHVPGAIYQEINSLYGHDGFLIETPSLVRCLEEWLDWP